MIYSFSIIKQNNIIFSHHYGGPKIENEVERIIKLIQHNLHDTTVLPIMIPHDEVNILLSEAGDLQFFLTTDTESQLQDYYLNLEQIKRLVESHEKKLEMSEWATSGPIVDQFMIDLNKIIIEITKICILGAPDVGKETFTNALTSQSPVSETLPSIAVEIQRIPGLFMGAYEIYIWDYTDEESFGAFIDYYLKKMGLIIFVSDSSPINVRQTKEVLSRLRRVLPNIPIAILANKQDLPNVWPPKMIERVLATPTHGIVLNDPRSKSKLDSFFQFAVGITQKK